MATKLITLGGQSLFPNQLFLTRWLPKCWQIQTIQILDKICIHVCSWYNVSIYWKLLGSLHKPVHSIVIAIDRFVLVLVFILPLTGMIWTAFPFSWPQTIISELAYHYSANYNFADDLTNVKSDQRLVGHHQVLAGHNIRSMLWF